MHNGAPHPRRPWVHAVALIPCAVLAVTLLASAAGAAQATKAAHRHHAPLPVVAVGQPAPVALISATAVSCGDVRHCWSVGFGSGATAAIVATRNGGATWVSETVPPSVSVLAGVSCSSKLDCMAVGSAGGTAAVLATDDGGEHWVLGQVPAGAAAVTAVDCVAKLGCIALGTDGMTYWSVLTSDQGASWVRGGNLPPGMSAAGITCPAVSSCLAAGFSPTGPGRGAGAIASSVDGGATWTAVPLPTGVGILRGVTCSAMTCLAAGTPSTATTGFVPAGGQLVSSLDGGQTWVLVTASIAHDDAFGTACPNAKTCIVVGTNWVGKTQPSPTGSIVTTLNGGGLWRQAALKFDPVGLAAIACPAVNSCVAVGGNVLVHVTLPVTPPAPKPKVTPGVRPRAPVR
jgi:photosystem II stability/assembly factor-like uncharacterized protein